MSLIWMLLSLSWIFFFLLGYYVRDLHLKGVGKLAQRLRGFTNAPLIMKFMAVLTVMLLGVSALSTKSWVESVRAKESSLSSAQLSEATKRAQIDSTCSALTLWKSLREQLTPPDIEGLPKEDKVRTLVFLGSLDTYISSLETLQETRGATCPKPKEGG